MSRVHAKTVELCESAPGFLSWLLEENSDFEEILADDGRSSNAVAIRQNVPSKSSSADTPPDTPEAPRISAPHGTRRSILTEIIRRAAIVEIRRPATAKWRRVAS